MVLCTDDSHDEVRHVCWEARAVARKGWVVVGWHAHGTCSGLSKVWWDRGFEHVDF